MAASSKIDFDDLDSLPVAATQPQGDSKRKSISIQEKKTSDVRGYRYNDPFAGDSLWMHVDLADGDASGSFRRNKVALAAAQREAVAANRAEARARERRKCGLQL